MWQKIFLGTITCLAVTACINSSGGRGGGANGQCDDVAGNWAFRGSCGDMDCTLTQTGCTARMDCGDGTVPAEVSGSHITFSPQEGTDCTASVAEGEASGSCTTPDDACEFAGSCIGGDCGKAPSTPMGNQGEIPAETETCSCNDGKACTIDTCTQTGCLYSIGPNNGITACPSGQYCTVEDGCVAAPACATALDCEESWANDACKTNIRCDLASSVCTFDVLDKDGDYSPPQVCGGNDCNDNDPGRFPGNLEACDQQDNDCDGQIDEGSDLCDPSMECISGSCSCRNEFLCGQDCVTDFATDGLHCGGCDKPCAENEVCEGGTCSCHVDATLCGTTCINLGFDSNNCGECGRVCAAEGGCRAGECYENVKCGGQFDFCEWPREVCLLADPSTDPYNPGYYTTVCRPNPCYMNADSECNACDDLCDIQCQTDGRRVECP